MKQGQGMADFFAELKRRHIYRVAAAYAVVAWVLLQLFNNDGAHTEAPPFGRAHDPRAFAGRRLPGRAGFCRVHQLGNAKGDAFRHATAGRLIGCLVGRGSPR